MTKLTIKLKVTEHSTNYYYLGLLKIKITKEIFIFLLNMRVYKLQLNFVLYAYNIDEYGWYNRYFLTILETIWPLKKTEHLYTIAKLWNEKFPQ